MAHEVRQTMLRVLGDERHPIDDREQETWLAERRGRGPPVLASPGEKLSVAIAQLGDELRVPGHGLG